MVSEKQTFDFVLNNFFTIWIKAKPKEHMERVIKQGDLRPMASNPKAMDDLNNILKERKNLYSQADVILDTKDKDPDTSYEDFKYLIKN
jgi:XRE family aerobic/anaerobic benzoate catabolism transcriptional regulator